MRLLIHDYAGHPFPVQLSRELARRGHQVLHLYAGYNQTPRGALICGEDDPETLEIRGVFIRSPLDKDNYIRRWFQEREYGRLAAVQIRKYQPDVAISANTPLDAQRVLLAECKAIGAKFVYWLQDFLGIGARSILRRNLLLLGDLIGRYQIQLEKDLLNRSDAIVAITDDFLPVLEGWSLSASRINVIPNWAPIELLPLGSKENPWSRELGLHARFTFLYSGTLRMKHNPALLLKLAKSLRNDPRMAQVVVITEGPAADWLQTKAISSELRNFRILGFQDILQYALVLASADVLVAILRKEAGKFSVPSKVLSYLCAGRPILLSVPGENLAAKIVRENQAGIVVEPDDTAGFLAAARNLMASPNLRMEMGKNARRYAEETFSIRRITDRFETLVGSLQ